MNDRDVPPLAPGLMVFMIVASLALVVLHDWWKKRLVLKAERQGKQPNEKLLNYRTNWGMVATMFAGPLLILAYFANEQSLHLPSWTPSGRTLTWLILFAGLAYVVITVTLIRRRIQRLVNELEALVADNQLDEALRRYRAEIDQDAGKVGLFSSILAALLAKGEAQTCLDLLDEYEALPVVGSNLQRSPAVLLNKAQALRQTGRLDDCLKCLTHAEQLAPQAVDIVCYKGEALLDAGQLAEAEAALRKADELYSRLWLRSTRKHCRPLLQSLRSRYMAAAAAADDARVPPQSR